MPRTRSLAWAELKIGVLTIIAIVIAAVTIFMLTGSRGFFWQRYNLKTRFTNVAGLKAGSPVRVAGKEVGLVTAVELAAEDVEVVFEVNEEVQSRITTDSVAKLGSISLAGRERGRHQPLGKGDSLFRSGAMCRRAVPLRSCQTLRIRPDRASRSSPASFTTFDPGAGRSAS